MAQCIENNGLNTWLVEAGDLKFTVVPARGATITKLSYKDLDFLYIDQSTLHQGRELEGGLQLLFPLCGPFIDGYALDEHGFARHSKFKVTQHGEDFIELRLTSNQKTMKMYPFKFELNYCYRLSKNRLWLTQLVVNHSDRPMSFQTGYNPYFLVGDERRIEWVVPIQSDHDNDAIDNLPSLYTDYIDLRAGVNLEFDRLPSRRAGFSDLQRGLGAIVGYGPQTSLEFPYYVVYAVPDKTFACLSPRSSSRFGISEGKAFLSPGECMQTQVWIEPHIGPISLWPQSVTEKLSKFRYSRTSS